ncbi:MAG: MBL fold metallo-hydrolase [Anaerolineae bacterium]|nr:MBL fold metallo-hydrolase [Anaerolineae bacterium]
MSHVTVERLEVAEPDWSFTMNSYIVRDEATGATAIVDPGADAERILQAAGPHVQQIWITHGDFDHVQALEKVKAATGAPVLAHGLEEERVPGGVDQLVSHGFLFHLGQTEVLTLFVPGHAPGHVAFVVPGHVLGGDILFPGGPGRTRTPGNFQLLLQGIENHLLTLDDSMVVHPGHGDPGTIGEAKRAYDQFKQRPNTEGLYGDVTWA